MKLIYPITSILILASCSLTRPVICTNRKEVTLTWKDSKSESIDVYIKNSLSFPNIPCKGENRFTMYDVSPGDYTFVFKSDGKVIEKKRIIIVDK
jgi:hypothetical protein